jgi:hypothetical protein
MRLLALALVLAQVVAPTPTAWTIPADPALAPALVSLAGVDEGRALLQALADAGVRLVIAVGVAPEADATTERLAEYRPATRMIVLSPRVRDMDAGTVATLLAHEASHVRDDASGTLARERGALGTVEACYTGEVRATLTELYVWQAVTGPVGNALPANEYEAFLDDALGAYYRDPEGYLPVVRALYAPLCERA